MRKGIPPNDFLSGIQCVRMPAPVLIVNHVILFDHSIVLFRLTVVCDKESEHHAAGAFG